MFAHPGHLPEVVVEMQGILRYAGPKDQMMDPKEGPNSQLPTALHFKRLKVCFASDSVIPPKSFTEFHCIDIRV